MATSPANQAPASLRTPLIDAEALLAALRSTDDRPRIVDCRFRLDDPAAGAAAWRRARIPGSVHADLDRDLSAAVEPGRTGRHPLPDLARIRARLARLGIAGDRPVVFLDDAGGPFAARAWWLACLAGHPDARVLDGGLAAWLEAGGPLDEQPPEPAAPAPPWPDRPPLVAAVDAGDVPLDGDPPLIDARTRPRFEGREEPIDPVAGHIPGARCAPFTGNLDTAGRFLPAAALQARWQPLLGADPGRAVCYCGSGVTAAHLVLAACVAGLAPPRLYPGSWSEWITDPERPVATGPEAPASA
jgi:thiosulfate/3-mercaptopyruvate sulfurtransferase